MNTTLISTPFRETQHRIYAKVYNDLGKDIVGYLRDKDVNEVMLNPDGSLWLDRASIGQEHVGFINKLQASSILNSIAGINDFIVQARRYLVNNFSRPCLK